MSGQGREHRSDERAGNEPSAGTPGAHVRRVLLTVHTGRHDIVELARTSAARLMAGGITVRVLADEADDLAIDGAEVVPGDEKAAHDAEIVIKLYELRREAVMRDSRKAVGRFLPKTFEELQELIRPDAPTNPQWRQVTSYWEMAYGMVRHGVLHPDFMIECNGTEGLFVLARVEPFLEQLRATGGPQTLANTFEARKLFLFLGGRQGIGARLSLDAR